MPRTLPWCRYADDGLVHCRERARSPGLKAELPTRLAECRHGNALRRSQDRLHGDGNRTGSITNIQFDFLGYGFRPRLRSTLQRQHAVLGLQPKAVSASALKAMRAAIRELNLRHPGQTLPMDEICRSGRSIRSCGGGSNTTDDARRRLCIPLLRYVNQMLLAWAMRKFKRFTAHKDPHGGRFLQKLAQEKAVGPVRALATGA